MLNEEESKAKGRYKFGVEKTREDMAISYPILAAHSLSLY
jgi:hypothetical protein